MADCLAGTQSFSAIAHAYQYALKMGAHIVSVSSGRTDILPNTTMVATGGKVNQEWIKAATRVGGG